jgi:hypothetical protein
MTDFEKARKEYIEDFNKRYEKKRELNGFFGNASSEHTATKKPTDSFDTQQDSETTRMAEEACLKLLRKISGPRKSPGLFSTIKYSKFLLKADTRFKDVYNFNMLNENKTEANLNILAFTVLFEEMRNNRKLPDEMEAIVYSIHDKCIFKPHLCPGGAELVDIEMYKILYFLYNQHRIRGEIPALAMVFAYYEAEENPLSKEDMKRFREEYSMSPIFTLD